MADHDSLYHRLFSHPGMTTQLLREFVAEPWLDDLDLDAMTRLNAKFHADSGDRREGDIVWRIPHRQGGDAYLLLLLEFQSTPEHRMALRIMVYTGLLWQQLIREQHLGPEDRLPPVFPVVLYNGKTRWKAPSSVHDLIALPPSSPLWPWQPQMKYHVIDEGAWPAADLARRDALAALLFRLERCREPEELKGLVDALLAWFRNHPGHEALKQAFATLVGRLLSAGEDVDPSLIPETLEEFVGMQYGLLSQWRQASEERGLQQGVLKGEAMLLTRQLTQRFGPLPAQAQEKIAQANPDALETWGLRVLDAETLDEVFL